jgi:hypothetical protein
MRTSQVHSLHLVQTTGKGYKTGIMDAGTILANPKIIHLEGFISQSNVITVMVCPRQKEPWCPPCNITLSKFIQQLPTHRCRSTVAWNNGHFHNAFSYFSIRKMLQKCYDQS